MNDESQAALMAFMDGESGQHGTLRCVTRLQQEPELRHAWESQVLASFLLQQGVRGWRPASAGFAERVRLAVASEVQLAPGPQVGKGRWVRFSSVAAVCVLSASVAVFGPWHGGTSHLNRVNSWSDQGVAQSGAAGPATFSLRPVRYSTLQNSAPSARTDLLIQRDIHAFWAPSAPHYGMTTERPQALRVVAFAKAGLLPVRFDRQAGVGRPLWISSGSDMP